MTVNNDNVTTGTENNFSECGSILVIHYMLSTKGLTTRKGPALETQSWTFFVILISRLQGLFH